MSRVAQPRKQQETKAKKYLLSLKSKLIFIDQGCPTRSPQSLLVQPFKEF